MTPYVPSTEQLVVEIVVERLERSLRFYTALGFGVVRAEDDFAELSWDDHRLFLVERSAFANSPTGARVPSFPSANLRVMVPDVDSHWADVRVLNAPVIHAIGDRPYGLRDFTIADPDGFGIRFASRLPPTP